MTSKKETRDKKQIQEKNLKNRYHISLEDYEKLKKKQNNRCAICKQKEKLFVDHDHSTGEVRGLLCNRHNIGLGMFSNNAILLSKALKYLKK